MILIRIGWNKLLGKCGKLTTTAHIHFLGPFNWQLYILDHFVIHFIRFYNQPVSSNNFITSMCQVTIQIKSNQIKSNFI